MNKTMHLFIILSIICVCLGSREPQCSQYHFLEQLLDKMIRAEVKVEGLQKHVDDGLAEMQATLQAFRDEKNKDHVAYSSQIAQQTELVQQTADNLKTMKDELSPPPLAFLARDFDSSDVSRGKKYVFTTILYNHGDGYDKNTGIFTAPQNGLYLFTVNLCAKNSKYACVAFLVNGNSKSKATNYSSAGETCNSLQLTIVLQTGDTVWLESTFDSSTSTDYHRRNTFSGALIQSY